jgi:ligand-binding sensor domain-containing protein
VLSLDGGQQWASIKLPETLDQISAMTVDDAGGLWIGGRQGIFVSDDKGATWQTVKNLYLRDVNSIFYDVASQRVLIAAGSKNTIAFAVQLPDRKIQYWNTGWNLRMVRPIGDHLVGTTWFDGVVIQPRMVDSKEMASH